MTFTLFSQVTVLGEIRGDGLTRDGQPLIDPSGLPVPEPDDGAQSTPVPLAAACAGLVSGPGDAGQSSFSSGRLHVTLTCTDSRLILLARSEEAGQWAGQIRFSSVTDVLVQPPTGRRTPGRVRLLFVDSAIHQDAPQRQYVDLLGIRKSRMSELGWSLAQRIVIDRRRLVPVGTPAREQLEALLRQGPAPVNQPGWYALTRSAPDPLAVAQTVRLAFPPSDAVAVPAVRWSEPTAGDGPPGGLTPADVSPWAPELVPAGRLAPLPVAGGLIASVPGLSRGDGAAPVAPGQEVGTRPARPASSLGHGGCRVRLDSGEDFAVDRPTLLGRHPAPDQGEAVELIPVVDSTFSYSKTHLLLDPTRGGLTVTDRHSTNGVVIEQGGRTASCPPGVPVPVRLPATLHIGARWLSVGTER